MLTQMVDELIWLRIKKKSSQHLVLEYPPKVDINNTNFNSSFGRVVQLV